MNVGHVRGAGGVDPTANRPEQTKRGETHEAKSAGTDQASISPESKAAFAAIGDLSTRVKQQPEVREDRVEAARERLASGELDSEEALRATAERLLDEV